MRASSVLHPLVRALALVTGLALSACGSGQVDACAGAPTGSCLTLEISGPSTAKVETLAVIATGAFDGQTSSAFDKPEPLPVRAGVVPKAGALGSVTFTVTGLDGEVTVGVGTVTHDLVVDDRAILEVELAASAAADLSVGDADGSADGATSCPDGGCSTVGMDCLTNADCASSEGCDITTHKCDPNQCHDGMQDGAEVGVDCGGGTCPGCAAGKACSAGTDCASSSCVDSICCATACASPCYSCSIPLSAGACTALPDGVSDTANFCEGAAVCEAGGQCVGAGGKAPFAAACTTDTDCYNGVCQGGYCKLAAGDPCGEHVACGSNLCKASVCTACVMDTDCPTLKCTSGVCALPGGAPCAADPDCASGSCSAEKFCVQSGSEACTVAGCFTHFCAAGQCETCSASTDCPMDTACTGGSCLAPKGAFCTAGAQCASGTCASAGLLSFSHCR